MESISKFFTPKRKKVDCSSDSDISPENRHTSKRPYHDLSDSVHDDDDENDECREVDMAVTLQEIKEQLDSLATKEDIGRLQGEVDKVFEKLSARIGQLESRCLDSEMRLDSFKREVQSVREENKALKADLRRQDEQMTRLASDANDQQQYDRRWNLRVFSLAETASETAEACEQKVCEIFTDLLGVPTKPEDLEAAHRTGPKAAGRKRTTIVRFQSRKLRDRVLAARKKLKGKGVSVDEDLTAANARLARDAYKHSATISSWSSHGKVFARLKDGRVVKLSFGVNVDTFLRQEMLKK